MSEKVKCAECGKEMSYINNRHLASHNLTADEYKARYPNSLMRTQEVADRLSQRSIESNKDRVGKPRTEAEIQAIREGVAKRPSRKGIPMGPKTEEQKIKHSEIMKNLYAEGKRTAPTLGKHLSEDIKNKISVSVSSFMEEKYKVKRAMENLKKQMPTQLEIRRLVAHSKMLDRVAEANLTAINNKISDEIFELKCNACGYTFTRTEQSFQPSKFHPEMCNQCYPLSKRSSEEIELAEWIKSTINCIVITSDWETLSPFELDIFIPDYQIAIEYCGLYWHSEEYRHRWHHRKKMEECNKKGIRLITIFEDEWFNNRSLVEDMLKNAFGLNTNKIGARKCISKQITPDEANEFLVKNHIQGRGRATVHYGLFYQDELVSVMTFYSGNDPTRKGNKKPEDHWEINRFCTKSGLTISGGASKLFSHFVKEYSPKQVNSYADLRWGTGKVYETLGFKFQGKTVPNFWCFNGKKVKGFTTNKRYHRFAVRKNQNDPANKTAWETRQAEGWKRIWDCGSSKWVWVP